jgi:hypothetical protein
MNRRNIFSSLGMTLLLLVAAARAHATSIELQVSNPVVAQGDLVNVLVYGIDFPDGTDGGDFMLGWAPNLSFVSLTIEDPPWDLSSFDASNAALGYVDYVDVFSLFDTPGVGGVAFDIATLTLQATDVGAAYVYLGTNLVGWSLAGAPIDYVLGPQTQVSVVPVPEPRAALLLWFHLALLAWTVGFTRPRRVVGTAAR